MPRISVITAVAPGRHGYLPQVYESLRDQGLPDGWSWEWLVQCDSMDSAARAEVRAVLPDDEPRLSYGASRACGPAIARTMTLSRATGGLAKTLNADDQLTPGALARDIQALCQPGVHWSASRLVELLPTGEHSVQGDETPPGGRLVANTIFNDYWSPTGVNVIVHPATLCVRTTLLLALGGWMALPAAEDTGLMLALDAVADGWFIHEVGLVYRCWPGQMTKQAAHLEPEERTARRRVITARAETLRACGGLFRL